MLRLKKIDDTTLNTNIKMVVSNFFILNKDNKVRFFEKSFLLANIKPNVVFGILFLTISNININFKTWNL